MDGVVEVECRAPKAGALPGYASSWTLAGTVGQTSGQQQSMQLSDRENDPPLGSTLQGAVQAKGNECISICKQVFEREFQSRKVLSAAFSAGIPAGPSERNGDQSLFHGE
jgi:hypothetical protein